MSTIRFTLIFFILSFSAPLFLFADNLPFCPTNKFQTELSQIFHRQKPPVPLLSESFLLPQRPTYAKASWNNIQIPLKALNYLGLDENRYPLNEAQIVENFNSMPDFQIKVLSSESGVWGTLKLEHGAQGVRILPSDFANELTQTGGGYNSNPILKKFAKTPGTDEDLLDFSQANKISKVVETMSSTQKTLCIHDFLNRAHLLAGGIKLLIHKAIPDQNLLRTVELRVQEAQLIESLKESRTNSELTELQLRLLRLKIFRRDLGETIDPYSILLRFSVSLRLLGQESTQARKIIEIEAKKALQYYDLQISEFNQWQKAHRVFLKNTDSPLPRIYRTELEILKDLAKESLSYIRSGVSMPSNPNPN